MPPSLPVEVIEWLKADPSLRSNFTEKNGYRHPVTNEHILSLYGRIVANPPPAPIVEPKPNAPSKGVPSPADIDLHILDVLCDKEFGISGRMDWILGAVPKVTFVTATRNRPERLMGAYRSCFNQTFLNWEMIILDGSDQPEALDALKLLCGDRRVKIFKTKGRMISPIWNFGISQARGKYICILDDDNGNDPDFLKYVVDAMDNDDSLAGVMTWFEFLNDAGKNLATGDSVKTPLVMFTDVQMYNCGDGNNLLWRRSDLEGLGNFDESLWTNEDFDLIRRVVKVGKIAVVPKVLHFYRNHSANRCHLLKELGHDRDYNLIINQEYGAVIKDYIERVDLSDISIEGLVDRMFYIPEWRPQQLRSEIIEFLQLLNTMAPQKILEIGMAKGGTTLLFHHAIKNPHETYGVDIDLTPDHQDTLTKRGVHAIKGDSRTLSLSLDLDGPFDVIFIDGNHTYEGVRADFKNYFDLVSPHGIIAFHDINQNNEELSCQVHEFWAELKKTYRTMEINHATPHTGYGIGIIFKDDATL